MADHVLENSALRVTVSDAGAELVSVLDKASGSERIWTADPSVWNRHAPILFPFVGRVAESRYRIGTAEYPMKTQHGFARDLVFALESTGSASVTHLLESCPETKAIYPYDFRLSVTHALDEADPRLLHIRWQVENRSQEEMRFSIGGHPAFLLPAGADKQSCFFASRRTTTFAASMWTAPRALPIRTVSAFSGPRRDLSPSRRASTTPGSSRRLRCAPCPLPGLTGRTM